MREINIGEKQVRVRATPLALFYYKQEFNSDLMKDLMALVLGFLKIVSEITGKKTEELSVENLKSIDTSKIDASKISAFSIDSIGFLQLTWAMAKADSYGKPFPGFVEWLNSFEWINVMDVSFLSAVLEEAADGFLRGGKK